MSKMDLGLEHIGVTTTDNTSIHQLASDVLIDCYEEQNIHDEAIDRIEAISKLKVISDSLDVLDETSCESLLDFYSQDEAFAAVVGVGNRKANLKKFVDNYSEELLDGVVLAADAKIALGAAGGAVVHAASAAGLGLYIGKQIYNKTISGCKNLCSKVGSSDFKTFDTRLANVPSCADLEKHMSNMITYCETLKAGVSDPKKFTPAIAVKLVSSLGFRNVKSEDIMSWSGAFSAAIFGTLKSIGWGAIAGIGAALVCLMCPGLTVPAIVLANTFFGYKVAKSYDDSYQKGRDIDAPTLCDMGYSSAKLSEICKDYVKICSILEEAADVKSINDVDKKSADLFKGTCNAFFTALKGTAKVIASLVRAATN